MSSRCHRRRRHAGRERWICRRCQGLVLSRWLLVRRRGSFRYIVDDHRGGAICANRESTANLSELNVWAVALSEDGQYLAGVSQDGHIGVWDLKADGAQIRDHETKGSFGTCIDLVSPVGIPSMAPTDMYSRPMVNSLPLGMRMVLSTSLPQNMDGCRSPFQVCTTHHESLRYLTHPRFGEARTSRGFLARWKDSCSCGRLESDRAV